MVQFILNAVCPDSVMPGVVAGNGVSVALNWELFKYKTELFYISANISS